MARVGLSILVAAAASNCVLATDPPPPEERREVRRVVRQLDDAWQPLGDWEDAAGFVEATLDRVWAENQWNDEADQFALNLAKSVSKLPPWDVPGRLHMLTGQIQERYGLNDDQRFELSQQIQGEMFKLITRHAGLILQQTQEVVGSLADGEGVTPEMVAKWTQEARPLREEALAGMDRIAGEFYKVLDDRQRSIMESDIKSFQKRREAFERMTQEWSAGKWKPEAWGLAADQPGPWSFDPRRESTWERYVRQFVAKYKLDQTQTEAAYSILRELANRAEAYRRSVVADLKARPSLDVNSDERLDPINQIFDELVTRLDRIPTAAQRSMVMSPESAPTATNLPPPTTDSS